LKTAARAVLRIVIALLAVVALYTLILCFPQPFFHWSVRDNNLSLYSDLPFSTEDGKKILSLVQNKLAASPVYSTDDRHAVFVCNTGWRRSIFFFQHPTAGGLNYYPITSNVFLSGAVIEENRLVSPSRLPDIFGRTLDHFIAHEITHTLTVKTAGFCKYRKLPNWIKEGYPEYVGRGQGSDYDEAVRAFLADAPEMNSPSVAPYLRYRLLVAYLLEKKNWTPSRLFENSIRQAEVEAMLKAEKL
jgi:hypothetical protein